MFSSSIEHNISSFSLAFIFIDSLYSLGVAVIYRRFLAGISSSLCTLVKFDSSLSFIFTPVVRWASSHIHRSTYLPAWCKASDTTSILWYVDIMTVRFFSLSATFICLNMLFTLVVAGTARSTTLSSSSSSPFIFLVAFASEQTQIALIGSLLSDIHALSV